MTDHHKVHFATLSPDGSLTNERHIKQSDIRRCEHFILMPGHYRTNGTCKCDDPNEAVMAEWGYVWNGKVWASPPEKEED